MMDCLGSLTHNRFPKLRQQLDKFIFFLMGQPPQNIIQPPGRVYALQFASAQQAIDNGRSLAGTVRTSKHIIFSSYSSGTDHPFRKIVVDLQHAIG